VRRPSRPVIITDAPESPAEELRHRQRRYILMMAGRAACLILAAVLAMVRAPLLPLWVAICLVGAIVLPWLAVVLANDRAPLAKYRLGARFRPRPDPPEPTQPALTRREHPTVIDVDP
jgi:hypothetical protein